MSSHRHWREALPGGESSRTVDRHRGLPPPSPSGPQVSTDDTAYLHKGPEQRAETLSPTRTSSWVVHRALVPYHIVPYVPPTLLRHPAPGTWTLFVGTLANINPPGIYTCSTYTELNQLHLSKMHCTPREAGSGRGRSMEAAVGPEDLGPPPALLRWEVGSGAQLPGFKPGSATHG